MPQPTTETHPSVTIRTISLAQLDEFATNCRDTADPRQVIPISPARLRSQLHNPCAADDDIVMVAAMYEDRCVGYHGILPGYYLYESELHKVYWATTFFVSEEMRGKGVGKMLVEAIQRLGIDFAVTRMTEAAERAYRSMGMKTLGHLDYRQLRADKLKRLLPGTGVDGYAAKPPFSWTKSLTGKMRGILVDNVVYPVVKKRFYSSLQRSIYSNGNRFTVEEVPEIRQWPKGDPSDSRRPRFHRPLEVVNWMLRYPWLSSADVSAENSGYYFSTTRDIFTFKAFEIYDSEGTMIGFTVLSILSHKKRVVVKLLDHSFLEPRHEHMALAIVFSCAGSFGADRIEYGAHLHRFMPADAATQRLVKDQRRLFLYHPGTPDSVLARGAADIVLDYCDGDVAFA